MAYFTHFQTGRMGKEEKGEKEKKKVERGMYQFNIIRIVKKRLKSHLAQGKAETRNHTDYIFVFSG